MPDKPAAAPPVEHPADAAVAVSVNKLEQLLHVAEKYAEKDEHLAGLIAHFRPL